MATMATGTVVTQGAPAAEGHPVVNRPGPSAPACCGATEQATCCAPSAKATCCGTSAEATAPRGGCGCR